LPIILYALTRISWTHHEEILRGTRLGEQSNINN
jgi:hypothetical protein